MTPHSSFSSFSRCLSSSSSRKSLIRVISPEPPPDLMLEVIKVLGDQTSIRRTWVSNPPPGDRAPASWQSVDLYRFLLLMEIHSEVALSIRRVSLRLSRDQFYDRRLQARLSIAFTNFLNLEALSTEGPPNVDSDVYWDEIPSPGLPSVLQRVEVRLTFEELVLKNVKRVPWGDICAAPFLHCLELLTVTLVKTSDDSRMLYRAGRCWRHLQYLSMCGPGIDLLYLLMDHLITGTSRTLVFGPSGLEILEVQLNGICQSCGLLNVLDAHSILKLETLSVKMTGPSHCTCANDCRHSVGRWILPRLRTLRHLKICVRSGTDNPYASLTHVLESIRRREDNIISSLELKIMAIRGFSSNKGEWSAFTDVLGRPGWDTLKRVGVDIQVAATHNSEPDRYLSSHLELEPGNMRYAQLSPLCYQSFKFFLDHFLGTSDDEQRAHLHP